MMFNMKNTISKKKHRYSIKVFLLIGFYITAIPPVFAQGSGQFTKTFGSNAQSLKESLKHARDLTEFKHVVHQIDEENRKNLQPLASLMLDSANRNYRLGNDSAALQDINEALILQKDSHVLLLSRAKIYMALSENEAALKDIHQVLEREHDNIHALFLRCEIEDQKKNPSASNKYRKELLQSFPALKNIKEHIKDYELTQ